MYETKQQNNKTKYVKNYDTVGRFSSSFLSAKYINISFINSLLMFSVRQLNHECRVLYEPKDYNHGSIISAIVQNICGFS